MSKKYKSLNQTLRETLSLQKPVKNENLEEVVVDEIAPEEDTVEQLETVVVEQKVEVKPQTKSVRPGSFSDLISK